MNFMQPEITTWCTVPSSVRLHLPVPWSCCDLDLWSLTPEHWRVHPSPKVHQHCKFGEIQSINFQEIMLTRLKSAFRDLELWPLTPKLEAFILVTKCTNAESLVKKYVQYFSRYCVNNVQDARTDAQTAQKYASSCLTLAEAQKAAEQ